MFALGGFRLIEVGTNRQIMLASALMPTAEAVIVTFPALWHVAKPLLMVSEESDVAHVIVSGVAG
jgi:hypothetical protein